MRLKWIWLFLALLFPMAAHASLPCSAYPNTLTNGTLADANQVMANFNTILNCVNSLSPLGTPVVGSESNVRSSLASAGTSVTVTADSIIVGSALNGSSYLLTSYSQTFNGATTGAGGMDTGALPTSGWVALYAIYNPTAPSISIVGTNCATSCPTVYAGANMPAGYAASALLTVLPTNATPAIVPSWTRGKKVTESPVAAINTSTSHGSFTSVSLATSVPPNAITFNGLALQTCGTTPGALGMSVSIAGDSAGSTQVLIAMNCASTSSANMDAVYGDIPITTAQTLWYENNVAGTSPTMQINIFGYTLP